MSYMNEHDLKQAREHYFAAGGLESDIGPRNDPTWYWRRAAKLWRERAEQTEKECTSAFTPLSGEKE